MVCVLAAGVASVEVMALPYVYKLLTIHLVELISQGVNERIAPRPDRVLIDLQSYYIPS